MSHANDTHPLVLRAEAIHLSREAVESFSREIPGEATVSGPERSPAVSTNAAAPAARRATNSF